ncbi:MAG: Gfo/Idh/MocA family oxidoreductase [Chloroflexia bacterium]|nr:Gfo/Idh/MocA family oxidoreductase [Chloroflexia bacterium]
MIASGEAPCPLVEDVDALLAMPAVDAVVVVSPASLHHNHIPRVAAAGKAVFAEKPLADSVERARQTADAVCRSGVPFQIGFQRRFDPGYARARELIAAGAIGEVEMLRALTCDRIPPVDFLRTSGGLFWDLAIHDFDAARFLTGDEIAAVFAVGAIAVEPWLAEFDDIDHGIVTLRFKRGALGVAQSCWRAPAGYDIRAEVHGSLGKVVTEVDEKFPTRLYRDNGVSMERHDQFIERFADAYRFELQAFVDALRADREPSPYLDDALRAVEIADAATRSRREGRWIEL